MKNTARITLIITGAVTALIATALVLGGSLALYGEIEKDDDGYLTTDAQRFSADTRALATENLDVDLGEGDWVVRPYDLGKVRLEAESRDGKELFVGIASTSDVERYLGGVPHTAVRGVDADVSAGADIPFLNELGWTALGSGSFALVLGIGLIVLGVRRPNDPTGTVATGSVPATA